LRNSACNEKIVIEIMSKVFILTIFFNFCIKFKLLEEIAAL
jgi:hypothetical protein